MPRNCDLSTELVQIVESFRHAVNHVVIFLNRPGVRAKNSYFDDIVSKYNFEVLKLNEAIRKIAVEKEMSQNCYNNLMQLRQAITTTGEELVAATLISYNGKCPSNSPPARHLTFQSFATTTPTLERPINFISNYLN